MAGENGSPAREPTSAGFRGRGRGGRGGRGRGRGGGRGASNTGISKSNAARGGRGGTRRGRAKNFQDSRVQAAYERQRDLKATYQLVSQALKPALQELAERNVDDLLQNPDRYKEVEEHYPVINQLQTNFANRLAEHNRRFECDMNLARTNLEHEQYVINQEFENGLEELLEQFYDGQENRLRILAALHRKDLPVDIRDDQYEYVTITDEHFDKEFGLYEPMKDGHLVPYPSRVEGTEMWQKARDFEAAAAAATAAATTNSVSAALTAPSRGRGRGRGGVKRRLLENPDGIPTPKRQTRGTVDDSQLLSAMPIAPAKGLLASAAEAEHTPEGTPGEEESTSGTPEPSGFFSALHSRENGKVDTREKSPALPKHVAEPDEYGVRIYNQKSSVRDKILSSRIIAPQSVRFDELDIGFRDSTNDSSKGHTRAKRGKYLDSPNSSGFHIDHWCNAFDYSTLKPEDFDKQLVKKHRVHPRYGIFLPESVNESPGTKPYVMPGKPIVFIANPSGRISHASRSFQKTVNFHRAVDAPWRQKIQASFRRFCKLQEIEPEEVAIEEYVPTDEELRARSLGTAQLELELESKPTSSQLSPQPETDLEVQDQDLKIEEERPDLSFLTDAATFIDAEEAAQAQAQAAQAQAQAQATPPPAPAPKPAAKYDAIRDLFVTESKPSPPISTPKPDQARLNILADLCLTGPPSPRNTAASLEHEAHYAPGPSSAPMPNYGPPETQVPISNEREASYIPPTPIVSIRDTLMAGDSVDRSGQVYGSQEPPSQHMSSAMRPHDPLADSRGYYPPPVQPIQHSVEPAPYAPIHDNVPPHQAPQPPAPEYQSSHHYPPPPQEQSHYGAPPQPGYPVPEYRENHSSQRGYEPRYERRSSGYSMDPAYSRPYWSQQPPPGVPPPVPTPPIAAPTLPPPQPASQHYLPPPHPGPAPGPAPGPSPARVPFSNHATAEPLPPLRPPRVRNQSIQEDVPIMDPALRPNPPPSNSYSPFYSSGPSRQYHHGYPGPETPTQQPLPSFQSQSNDRMLPQPPRGGSSYMASPPPQNYGPLTGSPTFSTLQMSGPPPLIQGSPDQQRLGLPGAFRHRSTGSGSSQADPNSKYRKLQPAPMPAHRAWNNKPELKTIPYDHKDSTGGTAALPNSGPTQIRGWNVNQHRRRPRSDKRDLSLDGMNEREDSR